MVRIPEVMRGECPEQDLQCIEAVAGTLSMFRRLLTLMADVSTPCQKACGQALV